MRYAAKTFGYSSGVFYILFSIIGFGVTGFSEWLEADVDYHLIVFRMNAGQNAVHMLLGIALMAGAAGTEGTARLITVLAGLVFGAIGIWGFYAVGQDWNILATNEAVSSLQLVTAVLALVVAVVSQPGGATAEESG